MPEKLIPVSAVAAKLGISAQTVYRMGQRGLLVIKRTSAVYGSKVTQVSLDALLKSRDLDLD